MGNYGLSFRRNQNRDSRRWCDERFIVIQSQLRARTVHTATLLADLRRKREMKMQRQEKDRKKEQQPDHAALPGDAGFHAGSAHN